MKSSEKQLEAFKGHKENGIVFIQITQTLEKSDVLVVLFAYA